MDIRQLTEGGEGIYPVVHVEGIYNNSGKVTPVLDVAQTLTAEQQEQARTNISVPSKAYVDNKDGLQDQEIDAINDTIDTMQGDITKATFINLTQEEWDEMPDADKDPNRYYAIYED